MASSVTFFPVDNGDTTLIKLNDKTTILIDINIRQAGEDENASACDVIQELRKRLEKDDDGRPSIDAFLLSHPDQDHCRGLQKYFHLGPLEDYNFDPPEGEDSKIVIRGMWSSPAVFGRASKHNPLCDDAKAFHKEAKRRVKVFRENGSPSDGDRITIIGEDENGKTDDLEEILVRVDEVFRKVNGKTNKHVSIRIVGPLPLQDDSEEEEQLTKNHSSVIMRFSLKAGDKEDACLFLTGGDAGVYIWERLWKKHESNPAVLEYDLLQTTHHCSWHSLSNDSWKDDENPQVNEEAKAALSQARDGAMIVASSKPIKDDKNDPPCWGAKKEYESMTESVDGQFFCTGEYPDKENPEPLTFKVSEESPQSPSKRSSSVTGPAIIGASTRVPLHHG